MNTDESTPAADDRSAVSAGAPAMESPVHRLLRRLLPDFAPAAAELWDRAGADNSAANALPILVNGSRFPVIRLPWQRVGDWFEEVYRRSNVEFFGGRLPLAKLTWNRRFRNLGGRIQPRLGLIELSSAHYEACGVAALGAVLVHEQIHYSLFVDKRPCGHTPEFKRRSSAVGLPNIRHDMPLPTRLQKPIVVHRYGCKCGRVVESRRRFRQTRACAACCKQFARGRFDIRFALRFLETKIRPIAEA